MSDERKKCRRCGGKARTADRIGYIHACCFALERESEVEST